MEEEILHQLVDGKHPNLIPWNLKCFDFPIVALVQDFATIRSISNKWETP